MRFGTAYNDTQTSWHFKFFTEQAEVYGDTNTNNIGNLIDDFDLIPILSFCKETVTFPTNTFLTYDSQSINTYFSYTGEVNK